MTISKAVYLAAPALFVCGTFIVYKFRYEQFGGGYESLQSVAEKKDRKPEGGTPSAMGYY
jgi:hypothetical protein